MHRRGCFGGITPVSQLTAGGPVTFRQLERVLFGALEINAQRQRRHWMRLPQPGAAEVTARCRSSTSLAQLIRDLLAAVPAPEHGQVGAQAVNQVQAEQGGKR